MSSRSTPNQDLDRGPTALQARAVAQLQDRDRDQDLTALLAPARVQGVTARPARARGPTVSQARAVAQLQDRDRDRDPAAAATL